MNITGLIPRCPRGPPGPLLLGKKGDSDRTARSNRLFMEGVSWRMCNGAGWWDIPERFGKWNSIHQRFRGWAKRVVFDRICKELRGKIDLECAMNDGTIVPDRQKASGARKTLGNRPSLARGVG